MKKFFAVVLALCMVLGMTPAAFAAERYTDVSETDWYYDEIDYVTEQGLMDGVTDTTFDPGTAATRADVMVALYRMEGSPEPTCPNPFPDVAEGDGDTDEAIVWASCVGLVTGYPDGTAQPDGQITRQELATLLYRYYQYKGYDLSASVELPFDDADEVGDWALTAMKWAVAEGIFSGVGNNLVDPQGTAERSHVAALLYKALARKHTVTFDANWSRGEDTAVSVADGETVTKPANPTRSGYSFGGWYTKSTGGTRFSFSTPITEDLTLYARWYAIHYCSYGDWTHNEGSDPSTHSRFCSCGSKETADCTLNGFDACPDCGYSDGSYHISSVDALTAFASDVNGGDDFSGKIIVLEDDVALPDNWTPIGNGARDGKAYSGNAFKGTFDGNGKTITNVNNSLFGIVDGGTVKNVKLVADITSSADSVGAAIAMMVNNATAEEITVSGSVTGADGVGGVVGRMTVEGTIKNCTNNAAVSATEDGGTAGGIVGKSYYTETGKEMTISDCTNTGTVTTPYAAGGIAGFSAANVTGCTNSADITAGTEAGGIVGEQTNYGEVSGNTNSAAINGSKAGGIIGWIRYQNNSSYANNEVIAVTNNTNSGTITGDSADQSSAGGIVGLAYKQAIVTGNSNSAASISAETFAAGIVGAIQEGQGLDIDGAKFVVSNNATTTAIESISADCTDLYVYNNEPGNSDFATIEGNGEKFVAEVDGVSYTDLQAALSAAAESGEPVVMTDDAAVTGSSGGYSKAGIAVNGATLDGDGNELTVTGANTTWDCAIYTTGGTIKNLTIGGAFRGIFTAGCSSDIIIDNVTIDDVCYTISSDGSNPNYSIIVTNSTINGWTSYTGGYKSVSFTDCTFGAGTGGYTYAYMRPYSATTLTNCAFSAGFEFDARQTDNTFINCTVGGVALTQDNLTELLGANAANAIVLDVNGNCQTSDAAAVADVLADGGNVQLTENVASTTTATGYGCADIQVNGGTLDGNGKTLSVDGSGDYSAIVTSGGTIQNLTIDDGFRAIFLQDLTEDIVLENVVSAGAGVGYAINTGTMVNGAYKLIATNCTFNGWSSFNGLESASFTSCHFGQGTYYGATSVYGRLVKPYVTTVFENCTFDQTFYIDLSALGAGCTITLDNCTVNGTVITVDNYTTLLETIELPGDGRALADCVIFQ